MSTRPKTHMCAKVKLTHVYTRTNALQFFVSWLVGFPDIVTSNVVRHFLKDGEVY